MLVNAFSVHPPFCRGVEPPTKFSKMGGGGGGGLTGSQLLEGNCWERGGYFFQGALQLSHKK